MEPEILQENISFFNKWAESYDLLLPLKLWFNHVQRKIIKSIQSNSRAKILDIGCGTGDALLMFKKKGFIHLNGLDLSSVMLAKARRKLGRKVVLKKSNVEKMPFQKDFFDIVISTEAFHHFPNPQKALQEINRIIKPQGRFYLADVNFFLLPVHWLFKKFEPGHVGINNKKQFRELFKQAGFKIVLQKRLGVFAILTVGEK